MLIFFCFFIKILDEINRSPIDLVITHLNLNTLHFDLNYFPIKFSFINPKNKFKIIYIYKYICNIDKIAFIILDKFKKKFALKNEENIK